MAFGPLTDREKATLREWWAAATKLGKPKMKYIRYVFLYRYLKQHCKKNPKCDIQTFDFEAHVSPNDDEPTNRASIDKFLAMHGIVPNALKYRATEQTTDQSVEAVLDWTYDELETCHRKLSSCKTDLDRCTTGGDAAPTPTPAPTPEPTAKPEPEPKPTDDFVTDGTVLSTAEGAFCLYVQKTNEKTHPPRTFSFQDVHVTDVTGCLYHAALTRVLTKWHSCFSDIAMSDGILWEGLVRDYLLERGYKKDRFDHLCTLKLKPVGSDIPDSMPTDVPSSAPAIEQVQPSPTRLIGRPDYYDGTTMIEIKRTRYSQEYVEKICSAKEKNFQSLNERFKTELGHPTRHVFVSTCQYWPNYLRQMVAYDHMCPSKAHELRVVYNEAPRFWNVSREIRDKGPAILKEFVNRLIVLCKLLGDPSKHKYLYDYESMTRHDETFCRDCPFLGNPCLGLSPLKRTSLRKREVELIKGLAKFYHRNLPDDVLAEIKKIKVPGELNEKGHVIKHGRISEELMLRLAVYQAKFAENRLKFANLSVEKLEEA